MLKKHIPPKCIPKEGFGLKAKLWFILSSALRVKFLSQLSFEETNVTKSIMEIILIIILITFSKNLRILFKYNLLQMLSTKNRKRSFDRTLIQSHDVHLLPTYKSNVYWWLWILLINRSHFIEHLYFEFASSRNILVLIIGLGLKLERLFTNIFLYLRINAWGSSKTWFRKWRWEYIALLCHLLVWLWGKLEKVSFLSHVFLFTLNAWEKFNIDIIWLPKSFSKTASSNLVILTFLIILKW